MRILLLIWTLSFMVSCTNKPKKSQEINYLNFSENILNYRISPKDSLDKSGLMFSDQGAWFAYGFNDSLQNQIGFSGPFLMTQDNGIWLTEYGFTNFLFGNNFNAKNIEWEKEKSFQKSYNSHLEIGFQNDSLNINGKLLFLNGNTALQKVILKNTSDRTITLQLSSPNSFYNIGLETSLEDTKTIKITSNKSRAIGYIKFLSDTINGMGLGNTFQLYFKPIKINSNESKEIIISHTFSFPEYSWEKEKMLIESINFDSVLNARKQEKNKQLKALITNRKTKFQDKKYAELLAKAHLTLQNNWRIPAGEIKHEGLFPSYHYKWFNGFWSWDSWKHAVGLSYYNSDLAKKQVKLMFDFQKEDGFIPDCVFRDTIIEKHNYRDTKPPLSAWAVSKIFEKDKDLEFVKEIYPKLKKYHYWWYAKRDHDKDGLCEYGSTDGSLMAAKWESGMDNAIRFDHSKILKNSEGAYSIDQESVDLNAYLFAEKIYLLKLAKALQLNEDAFEFNQEAERLKMKIQFQFYNSKDGWFYDTNLEGNTFIKGEGSEGWTALWANAATLEQAEAVKNNMMNPKKFFTKVPFQTMSADHKKFDPLKGYWRGPNWLDQAYFGVKGLRNYGFNIEADSATIQILKGAEGLLEKGKSIRENYHPITGEGLNAQNFSWSAAHVIMLLMKE